MVIFKSYVEQNGVTTIRFPVKGFENVAWGRLFTLKVSMMKMKITS